MFGFPLKGSAAAVNFVAVGNRPPYCRPVRASMTAKRGLERNAPHRRRAFRAS